MSALVSSAKYWGDYLCKIIWQGKIAKGSCKGRSKTISICVRHKAIYKIIRNQV